jgi:Ca2+:H+ antiporter
VARGLYYLLLLVPVVLIGRFFDLPPVVVFLLSAGALIPLAGLIGRATEELAHHLGPRYGGLLNATFGNAAELIITIFAVQRGLLTLVKASITGSIIGNTLLVLGMSLLAGGLRNGTQRYDPRTASLNSGMMILAIAGLYLPATVSLTLTDALPLESLSLLVAAALLLTYGAYLIYTFTQGRGAPLTPAPEAAPAAVPPAAPAEPGAGGPGATEAVHLPGPGRPGASGRPCWCSAERRLGRRR